MALICPFRPILKTHPLHHYVLRIITKNAIDIDIDIDAIHILSVNCWGSSTRRANSNDDVSMQKVVLT